MTKPGNTLLQVDDQHWVNLNDVRQVEFRRNEAAGAERFSPSRFDIIVWQKHGSDNIVHIGYDNESQAYQAWKRITKNLDGTLDEKQWIAGVEVARGAPGVLPTTEPSLGKDDEPYLKLKEQLGWLKKCVDEKLLDESEYQQGRAWVVAGVSNGPAPDFKLLYGKLAGLMKSKDSGLLSEDEAKKIRANVLRNAGLTE